MHYNRKIAYHTLGCKLNFSETSAIAAKLSEEGFEQVDFAESADYYIINTCSVTENADKKCRATVRQALKRAPQAKVIMIGCYAQLKPEQIAEIPGVNAVFGANEKFKLAEHLKSLDDQETTVVKAGDIKEIRHFDPAYSRGERTRSFLKVQDGCDYHCSFCTIPLARGKSRSRSVEETLIEARKAAKEGFREIVLTGVNIGDFGKTADGRKRTEECFLDLIIELDRIEEVDRWRISSIEPNLLSDEIIDFVASSHHFMPHFHIPLQSGNDVLLKSMRRKYDRTLYRRRVERIKQKMPNACIGVDVIVGYPGETEERFLDSVEFLKSLDVSYLHVFTYSERANTLAPNMEDAVDVSVRRERSKLLRQLSMQKKTAFYRTQVGQERPVLFEAAEDEGWMYGFTDNYLKVRSPFDEKKVNEILWVQLNEIGMGPVVDITFANKSAELAR